MTMLDRGKKAVLQLAENFGITFSNIFLNNFCQISQKTSLELVNYFTFTVQNFSFNLFFNFCLQSVNLLGVGGRSILIRIDCSSRDLGKTYLYDV